MRSKSLFIILTLLISISCLEQDKKKKNSTHTFDDGSVLPNIAITLVDSRYQSGQLALLNNNSEQLVSGLNSSTSGYSYFCNESSIYRLGRYNLNNFTRYELKTPGKVEAQFSTNGNERSSNPKTLVFLNDGSALLSRYASTKLWIVNPASNSTETFHMGSVDLEKYADSDGNPELEHMIYDGNNYAYLILNRISRNDGLWTYPKNILVLKLNVLSKTIEQELELDVANAYGRPAIYNNKLYIAAVHNMFGKDESRAGLQIIDLSTFTKSETLLKKRRFEQIAVTASGIYLVEYLDFMKNRMIRYDSITNDISKFERKGLFVTNLDSYENNLYISESVTNRYKLSIFDTDTNKSLANYNFDFMPIGLSFCGL